MAPLAPLTVLYNRTHVRSDVAALPAERHDDVHEEEGQPADHERRHDDRHRPRSLPLLRQRYLKFESLIYLTSR